jgi:hypothetical protein
LLQVLRESNQWLGKPCKLPDLMTRLLEALGKIVDGIR